MRRVRWSVVLAAVLVAGCIPGPQDEPVPITVPAQATAVPDPPAAGGSRTVTVYFQQNGRLTPVQRPTFDTSPGARLGLLLEGPSAAEVSDGVRTAVAPTAVARDVTYVVPDTAVVEVSPGFVQISGADQLLAVAQLVWTLTEHPGTTMVGITRDGVALEVPTDRGLSLVPVSRSEFDAIAPRETPTQTPTVTTPAISGTPTPTTSRNRHGVPAPRGVRPVSGPAPATVPSRRGGRLGRRHRDAPGSVATGPVATSATQSSPARPASC